MSAPLPIACSLSPDALAGRLEWISALNRRFLHAYYLERRTLRLVYDVAATEDVCSLVESERECCGFLTFTIFDSNGAIELQIGALTTDEMDSEPLFAPFLSSAAQATKADHQSL